MSPMQRRLKLKSTVPSSGPHRRHLAGLKGSVIKGIAAGLDDPKSVDYLHYETHTTAETQITSFYSSFQAALKNGHRTAK